MIASEITIIAEIFPRFTGRDVPISEIAKATGKSERFLKRVLREDIMHFGVAVKSDKPKHISCRFVRLNITFVLTFVRSLGTGTYAMYVLLSCPLVGIEY